MKLIPCKFNLDSGCVELRFEDRPPLDIDCSAVESKFGHTIQQRRKLDWLVYNAPLEHAQLVLITELRQLENPSWRFFHVPHQPVIAYYPMCCQVNESAIILSCE